MIYVLVSELQFQLVVGEPLKKDDHVPEKDIQDASEKNSAITSSTVDNVGTQTDGNHFRILVGILKNEWFYKHVVVQILYLEVPLNDWSILKVSSWIWDWRWKMPRVVILAWIHLFRNSNGRELFSSPKNFLKKKKKSSGHLNLWL